MNKDFSRIITLLRKERGLSQKQVAADLNISQALLSHYEKGIRECGLDFVVKTADYFGVSCDYLLGRTPERSGATLSVNDLPDAEKNVGAQTETHNILPTLNKKLVVNSVEILFELLDRINCKGLTTEVSNYIMVSIYKMFRTVYSANPKNPQAMFAIPTNLYKGFSSALQNISEASANALALGNTCGDFDGVNKQSAVSLSPEIINDRYPLYSSSLFNLIQTTENKMKMHIK